MESRLARGVLPPDNWLTHPSSVSAQWSCALPKSQWRAGLNLAGAASPRRWQPEGLREKRPVAPSCFPAFSALPDDAKSVSRALHWVQRRSHAQSMTGIPEPCCAS